jgi:primosomal protein N' (replication factor Y)
MLTGCVVRHDALVEEGTDVKNIAEAVDREPLLPASIVDLCRWVADYYVAGIGDALAVAMPPGARGKANAFRKQRVVRATVHGIELVRVKADSPVTEKQRAALEILAAASAGIVSTELRDRGVTAGVVSGLVRRGLASIESERDDRDPFERAAMADVVPDANREPTDEQRGALDELFALADTEEFRVALLHGVTGSGKTEIYLRLAERVVRRGRQVLLMVPEIALTPSVTALFRGAFGSRVAIQHSALSDGERHDQWHRIRRGEVDVVVGTRSAVFAPLDRLGLVIVDEEHDSSYKQEETPRYHGRDVAIVRASRERALVVLGSATPSMESYQNAASGKYVRITLAKRVLDRPLAAVRLVNMRTEYADEGPMRDQPRSCGGDCRSPRAPRAGARPVEPPWIFNSRVLSPVRRHVRVPELQRVAYRAPCSLPRGAKRVEGMAGEMSLLQLRRDGADAMPQVHRAVS